MLCIFCWKVKRDLNLQLWVWGALKGTDWLKQNEISGIFVLGCLEGHGLFLWKSLSVKGLEVIPQQFLGSGAEQNIEISK